MLLDVLYFIIRQIVYITISKNSNDNSHRLGLIIINHNFNLLGFACIINISSIGIKICSSFFNISNIYI